MHLDLIVAIILIISILFGLKKGFMFEFFSLFGVILSIIISKSAAVKIAEITGKDSNSASDMLIVYAASFLVIYLTLFLITLLFKKVFTKIFSEWTDRVLGGILGLIKGSIITLVILMILSGAAGINLKIKLYFEKSYSGKIFKKVSPEIAKIFPEEIEKKIIKYKQEKKVEDIIKKTVKERVQKEEEKIKTEKNIKKDTENKSKKNEKKASRDSEINKIIKSENERRELEEILEEIKKERKNEEGR